MNLINSVMGKKKISAYKLSKDSGIAYSTLQNIITGKTDIQSVSAKILYKLSQSLDVTMEQLYLNKEEESTVYISNTGRTVHVYVMGNHFIYMGPKNLVGFRNVTDIKINVIYVDTYFSDKDDRIYVEEDYIDLNDICSGHADLLDGPYKVLIGKPGESRAEHLVNNALLVSDNMAILLSDESSMENVIIEVSNVKRNREKMLMRLSDYAILYSDMSKNMQQRAESAVLNNQKIIRAEIKERLHA